MTDAILHAALDASGNVHFHTCFTSPVVISYTATFVVTLLIAQQNLIPISPTDADYKLSTSATELRDCY